MDEIVQRPQAVHAPLQDRQGPPGGGASSPQVEHATDRISHTQWEQGAGVQFEHICPTSQLHVCN